MKISEGKGKEVKSKRNQVQDSMCPLSVGVCLVFPEKRIYDNACEVLSVREACPSLSVQGFY